jgi:two-component system, sensor histidine kinase and response regulator
MGNTIHTLDPSDQEILIVDDATENIDVLAATLSRYKRIIATNGEKALNIAFGQKKPDLILLDIEMPGIDGYEVCRQLKANKETRLIPVIFLTSRTERRDIIKGFEAGAQDYVGKPFDIEELISRVNTHLELKQVREKLEILNTSLEEKVEIRTRELNEANINLEKAMKNLEVLDISKTEFLQMLSHEIRTPLNGIISPLMLLKDSIISDELHELFAVLEESTQRLEKFSYMALEITKLRTKGAKALVLGKINLRALIDESSAELSNELSKRKIELIINHDSTEPMVMGDREFLKRLFLALIGNAASHSPDNEILRIEGSIKPGSIIYRIIDRGKGFPVKILENDFQPMIEVEKHLDNKTGLELHFVKLVMDAHSGKIKIGNNDSGGAFVVLEFPISTV